MTGLMLLFSPNILSDQMGLSFNNCQAQPNTIIPPGSVRTVDSEDPPPQQNSGNTVACSIGCPILNKIHQIQDFSPEIAPIFPIFAIYAI